MSSPQAFIIMPYKEPFETVYKDVIVPTLSNSGFSAVRADEMIGSRPVVKDIQDSIRSSDLIIADMSGNNLNVYYELGMATVWEKDAILLAQSASDLPFDTKAIRHLIYDLNDLAKLKVSFEAWVRGSRAYLLKTRRELPKVLNRGDIFSSITDATFYLHNVTKDDKSEILNCIRNGLLIPPSFLYRFDRGVSLWLALCHDPEYRYFVESVHFFQNNIEGIFSAIGDDIITNAPDFISLGPGDGRKDRIFLSKLMDRQKSSRSDMYYYPYDISPSMISAAINTVSKLTKARDRLRIKAIVADFSQLRSFSPVYQYRRETNIFTLLGNTLGNIENETNFLDQLKQAMFPGGLHPVPKTPS